MTGSKPKITIVTPVFNEDLCLPAYEKAVTETLLTRDDMDFEILLVDDGSSDQSWRIIKEMCLRSDRFHAIRLSRNFGSHVAITAGIDRADGDAVVILACDLQDPPETVVAFVEKWQDGAEIVWGERRNRSDGTTRILTSKLFLTLIRRFAMPKGSKVATGSFLLMDRKVAKCVRECREHNRITFALVAWTGFEQEVVSYDRVARYAGQSHWTVSDMFKAAYNTFIGFSIVPARALTLIGLVTFLISLFSTLLLIANYLIRDVLVVGWTGIMITITLFFGIVFMMLGMMSEYLQRIFVETTNRPLYFVSNEVNTTEDPTKDA